MDTHRKIKSGETLKWNIRNPLVRTTWYVRTDQSSQNKKTEKKKKKKI